jgi:hypothetical protein
LTYVAKRRAEVTPGVGIESDLFFVTPQGFSFIPMELANALEESYQDIRAAQNAALEQGHIRVEKFCDSLMATAQQSQVQPQAQQQETESALKALPRKRRKRPEQAG